MVKAKRLIVGSPLLLITYPTKFMSNKNSNIKLLTNNKAHVPKKRPSNFICFAINSLFIMNSYLSLKRYAPSKEPKNIPIEKIPSQFV